MISERRQFLCCRLGQQHRRAVGILAVNGICRRLQCRRNTFGVLQKVHLFFQGILFAQFQPQLVHLGNQCFQLMPAVRLILFKLYQLVQPLGYLLQLAKCLLVLLQ